MRLEGTFSIHQWRHLGQLRFFFSVSINDALQNAGEGRHTDAGSNEKGVLSLENIGRRCSVRTIKVNLEWLQGDGARLSLSFAQVTVRLRKGHGSLICWLFWIIIVWRHLTHFNVDARLGEFSRCQGATGLALARFPSAAVLVAIRGNGQNHCPLAQTGERILDGFQVIS